MKHSRIKTHVQFACSKQCEHIMPNKTMQYRIEHTTSFGRFFRWVYVFCTTVSEIKEMKLYFVLFFPPLHYNLEFKRQGKNGFIGIFWANIREAQHWNSPLKRCLFFSLLFLWGKTNRTRLNSAYLSSILSAFLLLHCETLNIQALSH